MGNVLTFYLNGGLFGIDIKLVKEIDRNVDYTPIPDAKPYIVGLINLRGQIVTLLNLERLMGREYRNREQKVTCIILKNQSDDAGQLGILIDKSGDVIDIPEGDCEELPANMGDIEGEYINGVVKLRNELLMLLNVQKIFDN